MALLDVPLVSDAFVQRLRADLASAELVRFAAAYISAAGLHAVGEGLLERVLRHEKSFGVGSLTCPNGYEPLYRLQERLGGARLPRLKYFMEPMVPDPETRSHVRLLHTKLIYLAQPSQGRAIIYIGSHNWSARALGPNSPRNAEASFRLEQQFVPEDLEGVGTSLAAAVNGHLLNCYNLPLCVAADATNRAKFDEWTENVCDRPRGEPLEQRAIILAVRTPSARNESNSGPRWSALEGRSIYAQFFEEDEGSLVPDRGQKLFVLVWDSEAAFGAGEQPTLLVCHVSTSNAGPSSSIAGSNVAENPISGFSAVIFDRLQLQDAVDRNGRGTSRKPPTTLGSGLSVSTFDFEYPASSSDARNVDRGTRPTYQFNLEVDRVVLPEETARATGGDKQNSGLVWSPETFTVAEKRTGRIERSPGFLVDPPTEDRMLRCMREVFQVEPESVRARPYSDAKDPKVGLRISDHPLHDLLMGRARETAEIFYGKVKGNIGRLVPAWPDENQLFKREGRRLLRVSRVYARKLDRLMQDWGE